MQKINFERLEELNCQKQSKIEKLDKSSQTPIDK